MQPNMDHGILDQEPKDPRLEGVIEKLSVSARRLRDPRLLSYSSKPEKREMAIEHLSDDKAHFVGMYGINYGDAYISRPKEEPSLYERRAEVLLKTEYERLIPISVHRGDNRVYGVNDLKFISVLFNLDPNRPTILELSPDGNEVFEHPELLPRIIEAVSGKRVWD
jgi:hypothetical protein